MSYFCAQSSRREQLLESPLNGIDYLEVLGDPGCGTELAVTFLKDPQSLGLETTNVSITGGSPVGVVSVAPASDPLQVTVELDRTGDFSTYTFALVAAEGSVEPPDGVDPQLSHIDFSFKAGCATPGDCLPDSCCPATLLPAPDINYLAKDYDGFLQVMLDRLAVTAPGWAERHAADLGVAITEALAYAADHLSYHQDAVGTEAYIGTARSRISLRRHARLVDYRIGEGCNARTLVHVETATDALPIPALTLFYVEAPGLAVSAVAGDAVAERLAKTTQPVFTAMQDATLYRDHNEIQFYTWGGGDCCLPEGATEATLVGSLPNLKIGDVLIFEEVCGPRTAKRGDADPGHRCAVCLTSVGPATDPLTGAQVTNISWAAADALPFPLCISSTTDAEHEQQPLDGVSVARGNVVAADHGAWLTEPQIGPVPKLPPAPRASVGCNCGSDAVATRLVPRFYPTLGFAPLTFRGPFVGISSATAFLAPGAAGAEPQIEVTSDDGFAWAAAPDLLTAHPSDRAFVPEIEHDGRVFLRFGDGQYGMAPDTGRTFSVRYRIGNGTAGNVSRDTLAHAVLPVSAASSVNGVVAVRNPLPATGGTDPEDMEHIRRFAPFVYQRQERCVTEDDYGQQTTQLTGGLQARGTLRWTGSWHTAFVSIDPTELTSPVAAEAESGLGKLRMIGTDVVVEAAVIVGLVIELRICVEPEHFQGDVYDALMKAFITGDQCDGSRGLLNAANFSFGQTVYASPLMAAAQAVHGVRSASLVTFTRMDAPWVDGVAHGYLTMGRLDIPRCDNDPDHLDHGTFTLDLDGGK